MLGWEYPPHVTGGLATATAGVVDGVLAHGVEVALLLPTSQGVAPRAGLGVYELAGADLPAGYSHPGAVERFGMGLLEAVDYYAARAAELARGLDFDVIHAHDWLTAGAALRIAAESGRPWVLHVHATEFDRAGEQGHPRVLEIEREAVAQADLVIAVSRSTRDVLIRRYGADPARVHVVHNSVLHHGAWVPNESDEEGEHRPLVLFLGRLTFQKGPEYFVEAAIRVLSRRPNVLFVVAGDGDMRPRLMERVAAARLGRSILFTGFVRPEDARRLFASADLYVMTSVSEPFGITALEALDAGTPVIIPRGAGVGELVRHVLEVDFWDVRQLAERIVTALEYPTLRRELARRGHAALDRWTWEDAGARIAQFYHSLPLSVI
jgi:glycogen synthase